MKDGKIKSVKVGKIIEDLECEDKLGNFNYIFGAVGMAHALKEQGFLTKAQAETIDSYLGKEWRSRKMKREEEGTPSHK